MRLRFLAAILALLAAVSARAVNPPESVTIPLTLEQLPNGALKLGISVSLGGGPFQLYEFDTGGTAFYAANNTAWWSNYTTTSPIEVIQTYSSGIVYNATIVTTTIDLGYGLPVLTANMGQIQNASGSAVPDWNTKVASDIPPLWDHFFGDFGAAFSTSNGIFGLLPQLSGNLANGFIVRTGGFANPAPTLQIGLSDADRAAFPYAAPMQGASHTPVFPVSGYDTHHGPLLSGNASFFNGTHTTSFETGFVVDTGAPSMVVFDNGGNISLPAFFLDGNSNVDPGILATLSSGNFSLDVTAGNVSGLNLIGESPGTSGSINTGLIPFFQYDVMFDLQQGYLRFAPVTVPEPATTALAVAAGVGALSLIRRRSRR